MRWGYRWAAMGICMIGFVVVAQNTHVDEPNKTAFTVGLRLHEGDLRDS